MKRKKDIFELEKDYRDEVKSDVDKLNLHISLMYIDLQSIFNILHIYEIVNKEADKREANSQIMYFSNWGRFMFDNLADRVILGLSRVFVGKEEFSLLKTINRINSMKEFYGRTDVRIVMNDIQEFLDSSEMVSNVTTYRDKIFAHLDKECILTSSRMFPDSAIKNIDKKEVFRGMMLVRELWEICFDDKLNDFCYEFSDEEIIKEFFKNDECKYLK